MASPKSGSACATASPTRPTNAKEADVADPGSVTKAQAAPKEAPPPTLSQTGVPPHNPKSEENKAKKSWLAIFLKDQDDEPVPNEPYEVKLPDGTTVASGTLDAHGKARVEGIDPGQGQVTFPNRDKTVWQKIQGK